MPKKIINFKFLIIFCLYLTLEGKLSYSQEESSLDLTIKERSMSQALRILAQKANIEIMMSGESGNIMAGNVQGKYNLNGALEKLLSGTDLSYEFVSADSVVIKRSQSLSDMKKDRNSGAIIYGNEEQNNDESEEEDNQKTENIVVVTGSALVTDPAQLTRQVLSVTREEILETGATRLADYLLTLPQNLNAPTTVAAGSLDDAAAFGLAQNEFGDTGVNLRGLGEEYTLVLIDGERPSRAGLLADAFDISTIPLARIERIEIIFDNAVAIYGPDAVGGVLNIITRKDYEGTDVSVSVSVTDEPGGERYDASIGKSFAWDSGRLSFDVAIETQKRIDGSARNVDFLSNPGALAEHPTIDGVFVEPGTIERPTLRAPFSGVPLFWVRDVNGDGDTLDRELNERLPAAFSNLLEMEFDGRSITGVNAQRLATLRQIENYDPVNGLEAIGTSSELDRFLLDEGRDNISENGNRIVGNDLLTRIRDLSSDRQSISRSDFVPDYVSDVDNGSGINGLGLNYASYFPVFVVSMPAQISDPSRFSIYDIEEDSRRDENGNLIAPLPSDVPELGLDANNRDDAERIAQLMAARFPVFSDTPYNPQAGISLAPETTTVSGSIRVSQSINDIFGFSAVYSHSRREQRVEFSNSLRSINLGNRNFLDFTSGNRDALPFSSALLEFNDDGFLPTERPTDVRTDTLRVGLSGRLTKDVGIGLTATLNKRDSEAFRKNQFNQRFFDTINFPRIGSRTIVPLDDNGSPIRFDENGNPLLDENGDQGFRIIYPGIQQDDLVWWLPGLSQQGSLQTLLDRGITLPNTFSFSDGETRNIGASISGSLFQLPAGSVRGSLRLNKSKSTTQTFTTTVIVNSLFQSSLLSDPNAIIVNERGQATRLRTISGRRSSESYSGELSIPVFKDLSFSFATNDTTTNDIRSPGAAFQIGALWNPTDWFRLRWNRSIGDRLPTPTFVGLDIFLREVENGISIIENPGFPSIETVDYYVIQGGINDLTPERNTNDNFGLSIDFKDYGLNFAINYSINETKNIITQRAIGRGGIFDPESVTSELFELYLDPEFQAQTNGIFRSVDDNGGVTVGENVITGFIEGDSPAIVGSLVPGTLVVDQRFTNGGNREVNNIDFNISKVFEFENAGRLTIRYNHNTVLRDRTIQSNNCSSEVDEICGEGEELRLPPTTLDDFGGFGSSSGGREVFEFPFDRSVNSIETVDQRFNGFNGARLTNPIPEHSGSLSISWNYHGLNTSIFTSFRSDTSVVVYDEAPTRTFGIVSILRAGGRGAGNDNGFIGRDVLLRNTLLTTTKSARSVNLNVNYRLGEGIKFLDWMGNSGSIAFSVNGLFQKPAKVVSEVIRREFTIEEEDIPTLGTEVPTNGNFSVFNFNPRERTYDIRYQTNF